MISFSMKSAIKNKLDELVKVNISAKFVWYIIQSKKNIATFRCDFRNLKVILLLK